MHRMQNKSTGLAGNVIGCINEVNQLWARLVLGWVTPAGR